MSTKIIWERDASGKLVPSLQKVEEKPTLTRCCSLHFDKWFVKYKLTCYKERDVYEIPATNFSVIDDIDLKWRQHLSPGDIAAGEKAFYDEGRRIFKLLCGYAPQARRIQTSYCAESYPNIYEEQHTKIQLNIVEVKLP